MNSPLPDVAKPAAPTRLREDLIHSDPLLDCLVEICRLFGQAASRATLSAGMPLVDGRMTLELAERSVARAGMSAKLQRLGLDQMPLVSAPPAPAASAPVRKP